MDDTPAMRVLRARLAAHTRWAHTDDRRAATAAARAAARDRFEREVDPDGLLDEAERTIRASHARSAFYTRMAYRSAQVRQARKQTGDV